MADLDPRLNPRFILHQAATGAWSYVHVGGDENLRSRPSVSSSVRSAGQLRGAFCASAATWDLQMFDSKLNVTMSFW